jgi:hypothetical protein
MKIGEKASSLWKNVDCPICIAKRDNTKERWQKHKLKKLGGGLDGL